MRCIPSDYLSVLSRRCLCGERRSLAFGRVEQIKLRRRISVLQGDLPGIFEERIPRVHVARERALAAFPANFRAVLSRWFAPAAWRVPFSASSRDVCRPPSSGAVRRTDFAEQRVRNKPVVPASRRLRHACTQRERRRPARGPIGRKPRDFHDPRLVAEQPRNWARDDRHTHTLLLAKHPNGEQTRDRRFMV